MDFLDISGAKGSMGSGCPSYKIQDKICGFSWYFWSYSYFSTILCFPRHWIWVTRNIIMGRSTNIHTGNKSKAHGTRMYTLWNMGVKFVVILSTSRAIPLCEDIKPCLSRVSYSLCFWIIKQSKIIVFIFSHQIWII